MKVDEEFVENVLYTEFEAYIFMKDGQQPRTILLQFIKEPYLLCKFRTVGMTGWLCSHCRIFIRQSLPQGHGSFLPILFLLASLAI